MLRFAVPVSLNVREHFLMLTQAEIDAANEYGEKLRVAVHEIELPANERVRAAAACFAIGQDVHHSILKLIESRLYAGAFALVRVSFDAYIRAEWLWLCAKYNQVRRFLKGAEPPRIHAMLEELESKPVFQEQVLSSIHKRTWRTMCSYMHVGGLHVQRWVTADGIEPNYSADEVREALQFADILVALSVIGILGIASNDAAANSAEKVFEHYKLRLGAQ